MAPLANNPPMHALIAGATGFVGRRLAAALLADGMEVRCLVRDVTAERARELRRAGCEIVSAQLTDEQGMRAAMEGVDVAFFLVHMMGREVDYPAAEAAAARVFGRAASEAGVDQVVYLGGLGTGSGSRHLESREATAAALREEGPPLTYFRAGMIVGAGSESYVLVRDIVYRLPVVPDAAWLHTRTQPIGVRDVIAYLRRAPLVEAARGCEVQIGGPDVLEPFELIEETARALGRRPPLHVPIPGATPGVVAAGAEAVTTGSAGIASQLAHGLAGDTMVTDPAGMELFDVRPESLEVALQRAVEEDERSSQRSAA